MPGILPFTGRALDLSNPANKNHPLNRGLWGNWAVVPAGPYFGSARMLDLIGANHGTLSASSGMPTWTGANGRPGGQGSLRFTGSSADKQKVTVGTGPTAVSGFTLGGWLNISSLAASINSPWGMEDSSGTVAYCEFDIRSTGAVQCFQSLTTGTGNFQWTTTTGLISVGVWYHVLFVWDGTTGFVYINGVGYSATGTSNATAQSPSTFSIAAAGAYTPSQFWPGLVDDVVLYTRALSSSEALALYLESLAGNPNRWRWLSRRTWFVMGGGNTFTYQPSGGIVFGGSTAVSKTKVYSPSGGIIFSGSAVVAKEKNYAPSGGIVFGGSALLAKTKAYQPTGGIVFGGAAALAKVKNYLPSGGIQFGGAAQTSYTSGLAPSPTLPTVNDPVQTRYAVNDPVQTRYTVNDPVQTRYAVNDPVATT